MSLKGGEERYDAIRFPYKVWGTELRLSPGRDGIRITRRGGVVIALAALLTLALLIVVPVLPTLLAAL